MPNFEATAGRTPPQEAPSSSPDKDFVDEEINRLGNEAQDYDGDREKHFAQALEAVVDDEAKGYVTSIMDAIRSLPGDAMPSIEQMVVGLTKDAVERLKKSDASFAQITTESKGVQALVRRGLRKALEAEMRNLGADDLEILSKVEKTLDRIS